MILSSRLAAVGLATAVVFAAVGCSPSHPTQPGPANSTPPSSAPTLRTVALGQPFDAMGWHTTVTNSDCAAAACTVHFAFTRTGKDPAPFTGTAGGGDSPLDGAVGWDAAGAQYEGARQLVEGSNPGQSGTTTLEFHGGAGLKLVRLDLPAAGVTVAV